MPDATFTHDIRVPIELPDALAGLAPEQRAAAQHAGGDWYRVEGLGAFVACQLPVRLTGGSVVTFGTWLAVADTGRPGAGLPAGATVAGTLANAVPPWGQPLLHAPARAQVHRPGGAASIVASDHPLLSRLLAEVWDLDAVLSGLAVPLPLPVRYRLDERWSIERSAGLVPRLVRGRQRFLGPGRRVIIAAYTTPPGQSAEDVLRSVTDGATPVGTPVTERDAEGTHIRYAMRTSAEVDGATQHELYGFTIGPGGFLETVCIHDDPADAAWAAQVWRSVRQHD